MSAARSAWSALALLALLACGDTGAPAPDAIVTLESPIPEGEADVPTALLGVWERSETGEAMVFDTVKNSLVMGWRDSTASPAPFTAVAAPIGSGHLVAVIPATGDFLRWIAGFIPLRIEMGPEGLLLSHLAPSVLWERLTARPDPPDHYVCDPCGYGGTTILLTDPSELLWSRIVPELAREDVFARPEAWTRTSHAPRPTLMEWFPELTEGLSVGDG